MYIFLYISLYLVIASYSYASYAKLRKATQATQATQSYAKLRKLRKATQSYAKLRKLRKPLLIYIRMYGDNISIPVIIIKHFRIMYETYFVRIENK